MTLRVPLSRKPTSSLESVWFIDVLGIARGLYHHPFNPGTVGAPEVLVPASEFLMGSAEGEMDEGPQRTVALPDFYIDRYEVTNAAYEICVDLGVCRRSRFQKDPILGHERHPVVGVSWYDAERFCSWVGRF